tara:strand:- start:113 stop:787 length:675 start_codon:yes stop_codon:yes gene_type:complete
MKACFSRKNLHAVVQMAAKSDIRYYLNGVNVEWTPIETRLCATDGHALLLCREDAKGENTGAGTLIIPLDVVKKIVSWKSDVIPIEIEPVPNDAGWFTGSQCGQSIRFQAIDGEFPDYRRIMQREVSGVASQIDPSLLMAFKRAADILLGNKKSTGIVEVGHNGESGCTVTINSRDDFAGIVMPTRIRAYGDDKTPYPSPEWAYLVTPDAVPEVTPDTASGVSP